MRKPFTPTPAPTRKKILEMLRKGIRNEFQLAGELACGLPELRKELYALEQLGLIRPEYKKLDDLEFIYWQLI